MNDVRQRACEKHNTPIENLSEAIEQIRRSKTQMLEEHRSNRADKANREITKRHTELTKQLRLAGLELRSDSALCQQFMNGSTEHGIEYIVRRMSEMKHLFEYCHMGECLDIASEEQCDELDAGYLPDCSVFEQAEEIALKKYSNGRYPMIFEWQTIGRTPSTV
jgi:hypothetical protein